MADFQAFERFRKMNSNGGGNTWSQDRQEILAGTLMENLGEETFLRLKTCTLLCDPNSVPEEVLLFWIKLCHGS